MASREALQKLIQFGNAEQFATHAEDWSACSSAAILNAAVEQLGKLTQQQAYKDNAGTTVQDWNARRTELQESLKLARGVVVPTHNGHIPTDMPSATGCQRRLRALAGRFSTCA